MEIAPQFKRQQAQVIWEISAEHEEKIFPYETDQALGQKPKEVVGSSSLDLYPKFDLVLKAALL